jgi:hypothetical protein
MNKKILPSLLTVVGIALFTLVISLRFWMHYQETVNRAMAPSKPEVLGRSEGLVAFAWVDEGEVESDGVLRFWVLLENRMDSEVRNLRFLVVHTPGFEKEAPCWSSPDPSGYPQCRPGTRDRLPSVLEPGKSVTLFAHLKPKGWYGYHGASGVIAWQDNQGKNWERAFALPAVQVSSSRGRVLSAVGRSLDLLKDLALPLVLVLLGGYLQRRDKDREREKAEREKEKDVQREERDRSQAMLQETWNLMLPKLHSYAEKHYVPVAGSIQYFFSALDEKVDEKKTPKEQEKEAEEHHRQALFELLRLVCRMRCLVQTVGGLYLQDLDGEALAGACWRPFLFHARDALTREDLERAMLAISPDETYSQFTEKLKSSPSQVTQKLLTLIEPFRTWRNDESFQQDRALLMLFYCILSDETNRPYEVWYGIPASLRFKKKEFKDALSLLRSEEHGQLQKRLEAYLSRILLEQEETALRESLSRLSPAPEHGKVRKSFDTYLKQVGLEKANAKRASTNQEEELSLAGAFLKRTLLDQEEKELRESLSRLDQAPEYESLRKTLEAHLQRIALERDRAKKAVAERQEPSAAEGVGAGGSTLPQSALASLPPETDVTKVAGDSQTPPPD